MISRRRRASCGSSCACKETQIGQGQYVRMGGCASPSCVSSGARGTWELRCHLTGCGQKSPAKAESDIIALCNQATLKVSLDMMVRACSVRLTAVSQQIGLTVRNTQARSDCVGSRGSAGAVWVRITILFICMKALSAASRTLAEPPRVCQSIRFHHKISINKVSFLICSNLCLFIKVKI